MTISSSLSLPEAKALLDTFLKARNEARLDLLDGVFAPDYVAHDPSFPQPLVGLEAAKLQYLTMHKAAPDVKFTIEDIFVKDDRMVSVFTMAGTITGPFATPMGVLPPTGKPFKLIGTSVDRVAGGKIVESWIYFSPLDLLLPLGFALAPPAV